MRTVLKWPEHSTAKNLNAALIAASTVSESVDAGAPIKFDSVQVAMDIRTARDGRVTPMLLGRTDVASDHFERRVGCVDAERMTVGCGPGGVA
ncbi:MAG: hypothetical protein VX589_05720 [Myxococcota bacterium]|nr:hypothetical protein [Myxococcota bacterium]